MEDWGQFIDLEEEDIFKSRLKAYNTLLRRSRSRHSKTELSLKKEWLRLYSEIHLYNVTQPFWRNKVIAFETYKARNPFDFNPEMECLIDFANNPVAHQRQPATTFDLNISDWDDFDTDNKRRRDLGPYDLRFELGPYDYMG
jgi:hypothetical protein